MSAALEFADLRKTYRTQEALKGLSFGVDPGEIFGFIGVNGAGKSTAIKILLGLVQASAGQARVFGFPAGSLEARRRLGYLPEVATYHEFMSAEELLEIHASLAGVARARRRTRCLEAPDAVGLGARRSSRISDFSKGMKQRFGVAQAIVGEPPLLILDELTSGLDPFAQQELRAILVALRAKGTTIFFSSHLMSEVESVCDRVAIIHAGTLRACGTLDDLLACRGSEELTFELSPEARGTFAAAMKVSVGQLKKDLSSLLNQVAYGNERVVIESRGKPKAILISPEELARLEGDSRRRITEEVLSELERLRAVSPVGDAVGDLKALREGRVEKLAGGG